MHCGTRCRSCIRVICSARSRIASRRPCRRDRLDGLVEAMLAVTSGRRPDQTLRTMVHTAIELVDARYGALGVRAVMTVCAVMTTNPSHCRVASAFRSRRVLAGVKVRLRHATFTMNEDSR